MPTGKWVGPYSAYPDQVFDSYYLAPANWVGSERMLGYGDCLAVVQVFKELAALLLAALMG